MWKFNAYAEQLLFLQGDSGGPTVVQDDDGAFDVVGLSSWVVGSCLSERPNALTNVSYFNEWIDEHAVPLD